MRAVKARGASLKATEQPIDTSTAAGKCFLDMLGVFAEFETNLRKERQLEGIASARARGVYNSRKASIDPAKIKQMTAESTGPSAIAKALKIGRASVYRALASWRGHDHQAPIGFAVRGSSHRKGFFRHSLGKGKKFRVGTRYFVRRVTAPAGLWPSTAFVPLMIVGSGDTLTQF